MYLLQLWFGVLDQFYKHEINEEIFKAFLSTTSRLKTKWTFYPHSYCLCQHSSRLKPSPNTGVTTEPSSGDSRKASISVFTAASASGCVNKYPSSQNAAGPTLPWKQTEAHMATVIRPHLSLLQWQQRCPCSPNLWKSHKIWADCKECKWKKLRIVSGVQKRRAIMVYLKGPPRSLPLRRWDPRKSQRCQEHSMEREQPIKHH